MKPSHKLVFLYFLKSIYEFFKDEFDKKFNLTPNNSTLYFLFKKFLKKKIKTFSLWKMFQTFFPFLKWIPAYKFSYISGDIIAGSTVAILNIPQAMAYAALAGVPAIVGLYTSFFPPLLYLLFGTSRHISLGTLNSFLFQIQYFL